MRNRRSAKPKGVVFSLDEHRDLLRHHQYEFGIDVVDWAETIGLGAHEVRVEMEDLPNAPGYVRAYPVVEFESPDDAFAFKMKWL